MLSEKDQMKVVELDMEETWRGMHQMFRSCASLMRTQADAMDKRAEFAGEKWREAQEFSQRQAEARRAAANGEEH